MCKLQCLLLVVLQVFNHIQAWDIAVTVGDQIEFYNNGNKTSNELPRFRDLTALAYDAVHNMLLFVDRQSDNASIFSYHLATKKYQPLVKKKSYENIQGIAFDPVTGWLFWTDTIEKSIYRKSLMKDANNDLYGSLLLKMDEEIPRDIAVDSCGGYIYWTNTNTTRPTIERATFNGSDRSVVVDKNIFMPVSLTFDQRTNTLYWADDKEGIHYSIDSIKLDKTNVNEQNIINLVSGINHQPNSIAVSKDSVYWVDTGFKSIWKLPKNRKTTEPQQVTSFNNESPFGVVANYAIADQAEGVPECENLMNISLNKTVINDDIIPKDSGLFCLHGVLITGKQACECTLGYTGERCEIHVCQNYCFNGDCSPTSDGKPQCRCKKGYTGPRCELNICNNYCLNQGDCSMKDETPTCSCTSGFEGPRCETLIQKETNDNDKDETENRSSLSLPCPVGFGGPKCETPVHKETCNCTQEESENRTSSRSAIMEDGFVESSCPNGWDPVRDPIIMVLGILSGLMFVTSAVLTTKVLQLRRRPRIKKRIIVNKNVTPLTARPDQQQCEITIENCCNMNICETPCFEPRSTIRPKLLNGKTGKEEKKNLISNMEYPDDY